MRLCHCQLLLRFSKYYSFFPQEKLELLYVAGWSKSCWSKDVVGNGCIRAFHRLPKRALWAMFGLWALRWTTLIQVQCFRRLLPWLYMLQRTFSPSPMWIFQNYYIVFQGLATFFQAAYDRSWESELTFLRSPSQSNMHLLYTRAIQH